MKPIARPIANHQASDCDEESAIDDIVESLRTAAAAIVALLELSRTGRPVPAALCQAAREGAKALVDLARELRDAEAGAEVGVGQRH